MREDMFAGVSWSCWRICVLFLGLVYIGVPHTHLLCAAGLGGLPITVKAEEEQKERGGAGEKGRVAFTERRERERERWLSQKQNF